MDAYKPISRGRVVYIRWSIVKIILLVSAPFFAFFGFAYLSGIRPLVISNVKVEGYDRVNPTEVVMLVESYIEKPAFWFFSRRTIFFYPKKKMHSALLSSIPRIRTADLRVSDGNVLIVSISERQVEALWCGNEPKKENDELSTECYYLDDDAIVFARAPYFSGSVYLKWYGPVTDNEKILGSSYLDIKKFRNLQEFTESIRRLGIMPLAMVPMKNGQYALWLDPGPGRKDDILPKILFDSSSDLQKVALDFGSAIYVDPLKNQIENDYAKLQYIDLRFDNKVYYKFFK